MWVRDLPVPARLSYEECRKRSVEGTRRYWEAERPAREAERAAVRDAATAEIGPLSEREVLIAGAIAYWCEGAKSKPYTARRAGWRSSTATPMLIRLFLAFLGLAGCSTPAAASAECTFTRRPTSRLQLRYWPDTLPALHRISSAQPTTIKRHKPRTIRKNTGADYHGVPADLGIAGAGTCT